MVLHTVKVTQITDVLLYLICDVLMTLDSLRACVY